jgi:ElaB/YqjD/DUF883 family membrane-anchored ribosome-binding protein
VSLGLGAANVQSQSLGELAAKEKERRKGDTGRVVTEEDLAKGNRSGRANVPAAGTTAPGESAAAAPAASPTGKTDDEVRAEARKAWEQRKQQTQTEIDQLTKQTEDLERSLGDFRVSRVGPGRARAAEQLQQAKDQLAAARQRLDDLDEEGRRAGY